MRSRTIERDAVVPRQPHHIAAPCAARGQVPPAGPRPSATPASEATILRVFQPSQADVRRFFCRTHAKQRQGLPLDRMELIAAGWIAEHPEYDADLADEAAALAAVFSVEEGRTNPFLHLSMHLSIEEQCSIDQPTGIRQAVQLLAARRGTLHESHHEVMECLGEMIWASQRSGLPPDGEAYLEAVRRRATT